jgi:hypothetical protein
VIEQKQSVLPLLHSGILIGREGQMADTRVQVDILGSEENRGMNSMIMISTPDIRMSGRRKETTG